MFSVDHFITEYTSYSDEKLLQIYHSSDEYSNEAQKAIESIIEKRGGMNALYNRVSEQQKIKEEIERISKEAEGFANEQIDSFFIKKVTQSNILSSEEVLRIIDEKITKAEEAKEDKKIKPRTIVGSIIGGLIASLLSGLLWGSQIIYSGRVFSMLLIGILFINYGIIKLFTRQSNKNVVVLISTIISVILAILIGGVLYSIFGNRSPN